MPPVSRDRCSPDKHDIGNIYIGVHRLYDIRSLVSGVGGGEATKIRVRSLIMGRVVVGYRPLFPCLSPTEGR